MGNKHIFKTALATAFAAGLILAPIVAAQTISPASTNAPTGIKRDERRDDRQERERREREDNQKNNMAKLEARGDREINRRVNALRELLERLNRIKRLSPTDKSSLTSQVQTEINNLIALKAKIDADTDITTLRTDVQSIIKSYRVFALFIPKIHILAAADRMITSADLASQVVTKLQDRINKAQSAGKNVSALQTALADMQSKIADSKTQSANAQSLVTPLTPDGYPGNKSVLQQARAAIKTGIQDLNAAQADAKTIRQGLKSL